jgi:hypothetical protein
MDGIIVAGRDSNTAGAYFDGAGAQPAPGLVRGIRVWKCR